MTPKTYDNHKQSDKQTKIKNRVERENMILRTKFAISFNWGKINVIPPE